MSQQPQQQTSPIRPDSILQSIKDREIAYLLSGTRLLMKQAIPKLEIGSIILEPMSQGDMVELPRWIAEVLTSLGVCEPQEESFSGELFRAVNREKIAGQNQLADLRPDFYLKVRRHLAYARELANTKPASRADLERIKMLVYDIMALRIRKILNVATSLSPPPDIKDKLAPEEYELFDSIYNTIRAWRSIITEAT
jgi:hypothetical protein